MTVFVLCLSLSFSPSLFLAVSFSWWSFWSSRSNCPKREPGWGNNDRRPNLSCTFWRLNKAIVRFLETLLLLLRATLRRLSKEGSLLRSTSQYRVLLYICTTLLNNYTISCLTDYLYLLCKFSWYQLSGFSLKKYK